MVSNNLLDHFLRSAEVVFRTLDKDPPHLRVLHRLLCDLGLGAGLGLQLSYRLTIFAND